MAGYKQTIKNLSPKIFLTFDSDSTFDPVSGYNTFNNVIIDESGNGNDGLIITTSQPIKPYAMGAFGLVGQETYADQYSMTFCPRGFDTNAAFPYEKVMVIVPDNNSIQIPYDFTISFLFNKSSHEDIRSYTYNTTTGQYYYDTSSAAYAKSYFRQIFRKGLQVGMTVNYPYYSTSYCQFTFPSIALNWNLPSDFHDRTHHIVMTNKVNDLGGGQHTSTVCVFVDGYMIATNTTNPSYASTNSANTSEYQLGGTNDPVNYNYCNDRQTCALTIDQFVVFDFALNTNQVGDLIKKLDTYTNFLLLSKPALYWPMSDISTFTNSVTNLGTTTSYPATYVGTGTQITKSRPGPDRLMLEPSVKFTNGGMLSCLTNTNGAVPFNPSDDYTVEFWVNYETSTPGVIFSCQSNFYPFKGLLVEVNTNNGSQQTGMIEVSVNEVTRIITPSTGLNGDALYWNDGKWHHICVIRRSTTLEFWIDATLIGKIPVPTGALLDNAGSIYMMGMGPGHLEVGGYLSQIALYTTALQHQQIQARSNYFTKYLLIGSVTLQGVPHKALIRVFEHSSGRLLTTGMSDPSTGHYVINCYTENLIDVMILDMTNSNVRPRTLGPCLPNLYSDLNYGI